MKRFIYVGFILFLIVACNQSKKEFGDIIDIDPFFKTNKELQLSEIAHNVSYVRLETNPQSIIGRVRKIVLFEEMFFIQDRSTNSVLIFDASGIYISKIEQRGRGPGEFLQISDFTVLPVDSTIFIVDNLQRKVLKYDLAGIFLKEIRLQATATKISSLNDSLVAVQFNFPNFIDNDKYSITIFDRELLQQKKIISQDINVSESDDFSGHNMNFFAHVNDTLTFWEFKNDIIYKIINPDTIMQKYYIQYSHKIAQTDQRNFFAVAPNKNELIRFIETDYFMFFSGTTFGDDFRIVYFKDSGTGYNIFRGEDLDKLINDWDYGPDFFPDGVFSNGQVYQTFSMLEFLEDRRSSHPLPDALSFENVSMEDNPIIMLVTLK